MMKRISMFLYFILVWPVNIFCQNGTPIRAHSDSIESEIINNKQVYIRINQLGYLENDPKIALAFASQPIAGMFALVDTSTGSTIFSGTLQQSESRGWGNFPYYYELNFTSVEEPGDYFITLVKYNIHSPVFTIGSAGYGRYHEDLLEFLRQQRCGYNPHLDMVCHQRDGRTFYGSMPDSTYVDASGGWHDAGDQLKYLITSSNATARLLLAYELQPDKFRDQVDELGHPVPNDIPDVLDEAKWGLEWIHKMHPKADQLFHQVADDRDHIGWKWPDQDSSDYGWGPNSYRALYFANGSPQGLRQYKSQATGIANLAGRSAAAMAMAARIWQNHLGDTVYAEKCLNAAVELYDLGRQNEGYQQGNSYGAPYRYTESTWADDMEWGAAELYKATGKTSYLRDAKAYALQIGKTSWTDKDSTRHYEFYPFVNVGHYALYDLVDSHMKQKLSAFYKAGIEETVKRAQSNPYGIGVPFIWCSNNLTVALITQILLYENMTGDHRYQSHMIAHRDWLLGRNPWGTSMFTGIPRNGEYPLDVHTSVWFLTKQVVPGGLVDGPVYASIYNNLKGLQLLQPDEFVLFQNDHVVYHDDIGDYSTNEPTMDGTAGAVFLMAYFGMESLE